MIHRYKESQGYKCGAAHTAIKGSILLKSIADCCIVAAERGLYGIYCSKAPVEHITKLQDTLPSLGFKVESLADLKDAEFVPVRVFGWGWRDAPPEKEDCLEVEATTNMGNQAWYEKL